MVIAIVIAIPISVFLGDMLLQEMSQRIPMGVGLFMPGVAVIILLSVLTIGSQTLKAAYVNPVKGLRTE